MQLELDATTILPSLLQYGRRIGALLHPGTSGITDDARRGVLLCRALRGKHSTRGRLPAATMPKTPGTSKTRRHVSLYLEDALRVLSLPHVGDGTHVRRPRGGPPLLVDLRKRAAGPSTREERIGSGVGREPEQGRHFGQQDHRPPPPPDGCICDPPHEATSPRVEFRSCSVFSWAAAAVALTCTSSQTRPKLGPSPDGTASGHWV